MSLLSHHLSNSVLLITDFFLSAAFLLIFPPLLSRERLEELSLAISVSSFKTLLQVDLKHISMDRNKSLPTDVDLLNLLVSIFILKIFIDRCTRPDLYGFCCLSHTALTALCALCFYLWSSSLSPLIQFSICVHVVTACNPIALDSQLN